MDYALTAHAEMALSERNIMIGWLEQVLLRPTRVEPDKLDPDLTHALGRIQQQDNRVLRVIYNHRSRPVKIVTVYFDRAMRDKL
jgi:hypothetical protein